MLHLLEITIIFCMRFNLKMIKIDIISVGKLKEKFLQEASNEYIKRLQPFCKINIIEVTEYKCCNNPNQSQIQKVIVEEGKYISKKIDPKSFKISLCIEGHLESSKKLSDKFLKLTTIHGKNHFTFIIGGSHGLSEQVKQFSDFKLSMSPLTFPHQLSRIMLLEQIYRIFTIQSGKTYHK